MANHYVVVMIIVHSKPRFLWRSCFCNEDKRCGVVIAVVEVLWLLALCWGIAVLMVSILIESHVLVMVVVMVVAVVLHVSTIIMKI